MVTIIGLAAAADRNFDDVKVGMTVNLVCWLVALTGSCYTNLTLGVYPRQGKQG